MFYGRSKAVIDKKWRLYLPVKFRREFGSNLDSGRIVVMEGKGHIRLYPYNDGDSFLMGRKPADVEVVPAREVGESVRMTIPEIFRESSSFANGCSVVVAGMGDHLEILPADQKTKKKAAAARRQSQ